MLRDLLRVVFLFESSGDSGGSSGATPAGDTGGGEGTGEGAAPAAGSGIEGLSSAFNEFAERFGSEFGQRLDGIEQRLAPPEEPPAEPEEFDPDPYMAEDGSGMTVEGLREFIRHEAEQLAAQQYGPQLEQLSQALSQQQQAAQMDRRVSEANELEQRYPALQDEAMQERVIGRAQERAANLAAMTGNAEIAELWREPTFVEETFLAMAGAEGRGAGDVGNGSAVTLERGSSAQPAGDGGQDTNTAARLVALATKQHHRIGR